MQRREFITLIAGAATAWTGEARAQQPERVRRIAVLAGYGEDDPQERANLAAFQQRLNELGWVVGQNVRIDYRWSRGDSERAQMLAKELIDLRPEVVLGEATTSVKALTRTTSVVPIVFTSLSDPIGSGLIDNLAKPGGNVTGFTNFESSMGGKWLELLKEFAPSTMRVAIMFNPIVSPHIARGYYLDSIKTAGDRLSVDWKVVAVQDPADIERSLDEFGREAHGGLLVLPDTFAIVHRDVITAASVKHQLPAIYSFRSFVGAGGLLYYGINPLDQYPKAAMYVDRILRGEKPANLPVQAPTKFELVVNLKTAKSLGLTIPQTLLATADEVIE